MSIPSSPLMGDNPQLPVLGWGSRTAGQPRHPPGTSQAPTSSFSRSTAAQVCILLVCPCAPRKMMEATGLYGKLIPLKVIVLPTRAFSANSPAILRIALSGTVLTLDAYSTVHCLRDSLKGTNAGWLSITTTMANWICPSILIMSVASIPLT